MKILKEYNKRQIGGKKTLKEIRDKHKNMKSLKELELNQPLTNRPKSPKKMPKSKPIVEKNVEIICRLCGNLSREMESIFSFKKGRLLSDLIITICPVRIEISDELPKVVCDECTEVIRTANELREKSVQVDMKFRKGKGQMVFDSNVIIKEETSNEIVVFENDPFTSPEKTRSMVNDVFMSSDVDEDESYSMEQGTEGKLSSVSVGQSSKMQELDFTLNDSESQYFNQHSEDDTGSSSSENESNEESPSKYDFKLLNRLSFTLAPNTSFKELKKNKKTPVDAQKFSCAQCTLGFRSQQQLNSHQVEAHETTTISKGDEENKCPYCDVAFDSKNKRLWRRLDSHIRKSHIDRLENLFECKLCQRQYALERLLIPHNAFHKRKDKMRAYQHSCSRCTFRFKSKESLDNHMRNHDTNVYSCHICGLLLSSSSGLKSHLSSHLVSLDLFQMLFFFKFSNFLGCEGIQMSTMSFVVFLLECAQLSFFGSFDCPALQLRQMRKHFQAESRNGIAHETGSQ